MSAAIHQEPAVEGWFATDPAGVPHLIGSRCGECGTYVFPPRANYCPNPGCDGAELEQVPLSRRGTLWSYTENRYAPPPPDPAPDPFAPFAVAAVELADEGLIILGKAGLSEWANSFGSQPSGFSNLTGQVLNANDAAEGPSGSSSGSGAAEAAGLVPLSWER